ncbi:hypothetical protein [Streptomyces sp. NPDC048172]|uniref:hypothetical protein n=1 Tax=Streptomyces sp. NPDC048172 TaxID=3365505 RepID=UPI003714F8F7
MSAADRTADRYRCSFAGGVAFGIVQHDARPAQRANLRHVVTGREAAGGIGSQRVGDLDGGRVNAA